MFSADLSWSTPNTETVGERRERKARERSSATASIKTSSSSRSSVNVDRELWWTSSLKKAKGIKSNILRPSSHHSIKSPTPSLSPPQKSSLKYTNEVRDPTLQPAWTLLNTLSPTLPSGASLDPPIHDVPELEGDSSSRRTNSTETRGSPPEHRWQVRTPTRVHIIDEAFPEQTFETPRCISSSKRNSVTFADDKAATPRASPHPKQPTPAISQGRPLYEPSSSNHHGEVGSRVEHIDHDPAEERYSKTPAVGCALMSQWESLAPCVVPKKENLAPLPVVKKSPVAHSSTFELTRFQRFIRRMERAGPKIILERLREDWEETSDEEPDEQLILEKQIWLLTAFQLQTKSQSPTIPTPNCDTGRILELYGNLSQVFHLSALHPTRTIHFLTPTPHRPLLLPPNVSYLTVRNCAAVPLPYPESYFSHIRASTLPSLVPSSALPALFRECYKLLAPGGLLELRVMDAAPVRRSAGPLLRAWIEDRVAVNVERGFRCSKPCELVPGWLGGAGFGVDEAGSVGVELPCALDGEKGGVERELAVEVGRGMWRDVWGAFVDGEEGEWWWEDEGILNECRERGTAFECRVIYAYRLGDE